MVFVHEEKNPIAFSLGFLASVLLLYRSNMEFLTFASAR